MRDGTGEARPHDSSAPGVRRVSVMAETCCGAGGERTESGGEQLNDKHNDDMPRGRTGRVDGDDR